MNIFMKIIKKIREGYLKEMYEEAKWMYQYAKRYWTSICFYIAAGVCSTLMGLGGSVMSKHLIDAVTEGKSSGLAYIAGIIIFMALANIGMRAFISRISAKINVTIQNELQADIYTKVIYTDWESLNEYRSGDLLNRLSGDCSQVASSVISWIPNLVTKTVQFAGALGIILYYDPVMAVIAMMSAPVTLFISKYLIKRMREYNKEMREITSDLMSYQNDSFQNLQTLKAFGLMDFFKDNLIHLQNHYKGKMLDYNKFSIYTSSFMSIVGMTVSYICFGWSIYRLWSGYITIGTMMMFMQMANSLSASFSALIQVVPAAINAATCAGRLMAVTELEKEQIFEPDAVKQMKKSSGSGISVQLTEVDAAYKEGNIVVHQGNFRADKGEIVAIIGPSGEGKTTIIRLLLGLIYPQKGEAQLVDIQGHTCPISAATRTFFGYVPQGNTVFAGSIAENMRMVKPDASDEEIIDALKAGCAYEFVEKLPKGIHSVIGESGAGFSEGQAQRLAIARAVLKDAPVLLLDEATSALDMEIEERVLSNIMQHGKEKTCIVTTHRPSVLTMSDHIYEIRDNRLIKKK